MCEVGKQVYKLELKLGATILEHKVRLEKAMRARADVKLAFSRGDVVIIVADDQKWVLKKLEKVGDDQIYVEKYALMDSATPSKSGVVQGVRIRVESRASSQQPPLFPEPPAPTEEEVLEGYEALWLP